MRGFWAVERILPNLQFVAVAILVVMALLASKQLSFPQGAKLSSGKDKLTPPADSQTEAAGITMELGGERFLEVPHIVWGLNNQKIAIARAALTARYLNRTLLPPTLSSSVYINASDTMPFTYLFSLATFNDRCKGFVKMGTPDVIATSSRVTIMDVKLGSGRKWTTEHDMQQLETQKGVEFDGVVTMRMVGRNPFLWPDHWPVHDYARVLGCLVLTDALQPQVDRVLSKLRQTSHQDVANDKPRYMAVHMRVERDWRLHCHHLEDRALRRTGTRLHICTTKDEIVRRVPLIPHQLPKPAIVYLATAVFLLENPSLLQGWGKEMVPVEKTTLGVLEVYQKLPYIMQSAIDFEVCRLADVFAGNSFSTFSSLVVMARAMEMQRLGELDACGTSMPSFAYNVAGTGSPRPWVTNMSEPTLQSISYGSNEVGCQPHIDNFFTSK